MCYRVLSVLQSVNVLQGVKCVTECCRVLMCYSVKGVRVLQGVTGC
jgi:hypothetical protein